MEKPTGVHHVGFGVRNIAANRKFYQETLEFTDFVEEVEESFNSMADTFRNSQHSFRGFLVCQEAGGITIEVIAKQYPTPRSIHKKPLLGDIGVNKMTIAVQDVNKFYKEYQDRITFCGKPRSVSLPKLGDYEFVFGRDPEGNIIEFAAQAGAKAENGMFGGVLSLGLSVTDIERSKAWYMEYCDFDVIVDEHDKFSGMADEISESKGVLIKTCLLDSSKREMGGMLELYEVSNPKGRSIPFGTEWGDYGYMEICMYHPGNIHDLAKFYMDQGLDIVQRPTHFGDDETGSIEYWFTYVRDPDGIFVESVGMHAK